MERNQKIMLVVGITATAALIGWAIYASTQSAVEEGGGESGGGESGGEGEPTPPNPATVLVSQVKSPDGKSYIYTYKDGHTVTKTIVQAIADAKKTVASRGADGSRSWSNATGYIC